LSKILKNGVKFPDPGDPGRGFYINPSRRGPAVPGGGKKRGFRDPPGGEGLLGLRGRSQTVLRDPRSPDPPRGTAGPRREGLM